MYVKIGEGKIFIPDNYISASVKYSFARWLARMVFINLGCTVPVDVKNILERLEVDVVYESDYIGMRGRPLPEKVLAVFIPTKPWVAKGGMIILRAGMIPQRERFTLAHELYHVILRPKGISLSSPGPFLKVHEREADIFASELLMPEEEMYDAFSNGYRTPAAISKLFFVSKQAAEIRLKELNLQ